MSNVLLVDDEEIVRRIVERTLHNDCTVTAVSSFQEARIVLDEMEPDVAVVDWLLESENDGGDVIRHLHARWPDARVIVISGLPLTAIEQQVRELNVFWFLTKPFTLDQLARAVRSALEEPCGPHALHVC